MKNLHRPLLIVSLAISGAVVPSHGVPVPEQPAARQMAEPGAGQAAAPAFEPGFRGRPETNTNVAIKDAGIHVRFYKEEFDPVAGQFVKEQVRITPGIHDVRVRYVDAATKQAVEIPFTQFAFFKPTNLAGPAFTLIYKFPGRSEVSLPMRLTKEDFASGRANGLGALKYIDLEAPK